jgi:hypothetical protein
MLGRLLVIAALSGLSACGVIRGSQVSQMDAAQIAQVSDRDLCRTYSSGEVVMAERQRRGLADCSVAHLKCRQMGYAPGTEIYLKCRAMVANQEAIEDTNRTAASIGMMQAGAAIASGGR